MSDIERAEVGSRPVTVEHLAPRGKPGQGEYGMAHSLDGERAFVEQVAVESDDAAFHLAGWLFMRARLGEILCDADAWRLQASREAGDLPREWIDDVFLPSCGVLDGDCLYGSPYRLGDDGRPALPYDDGTVTPEVYLLGEAQQFAFALCMDHPQVVGRLFERLPWTAPTLIDDSSRAAMVVADLGEISTSVAVAPVLRAIGDLG